MILAICISQIFFNFPSYGQEITIKTKPITYVLFNPNLAIEYQLSERWFAEAAYVFYNHHVWLLGSSNSTGHKGGIGIKRKIGKMQTDFEPFYAFRTAYSRIFDFKVYRYDPIAFSRYHHTENRLYKRIEINGNIGFSLIIAKAIVVEAYVGLEYFFAMEENTVTDYPYYDDPPQEQQDIQPGFTYQSDYNGFFPSGAFSIGYRFGKPL